MLLYVPQVCAVCDGLREVTLYRHRVQAAEKKTKHLIHTKTRRASTVRAPMTRILLYMITYVLPISV